MQKKTENKSNTALKDQLENFLDSDKGSAQITKVLLAVVALGGAVLLAAAAPGLLQIFGNHKRSRKYSKQQLRNGFYSLKRRGFINVIEGKNGKSKIQLTKKGEKTIKEFSITSLSIPKPSKWDCKWRVLIFDIPNKYQKARNALREKVRELGFFMLQKSVWVYPYPCENEILFVAHCFGVESFIEILTVENLLCGESETRRRFEL